MANRFLLSLLAVLSLTQLTYAKSAIIYAPDENGEKTEITQPGTVNNPAQTGIIYAPRYIEDEDGNLIEDDRDTGNLAPNSNDPSKPLTETPINYPQLVKKGKSFICMTSGDKEFQLYGWQQILDWSTGQPTWYYFDQKSGQMLVNDWTEDGYYMGSDGKIVSAANNARDWTTPGFKFRQSKKELTYLFKDLTTPSGCWVAISPLGDNLFYWYYFDYDGLLHTSSTKIQGKYKVNKSGQYVDEKNQVVQFYLTDSEEPRRYADPTFEDKAGNKQNAIIYVHDDPVGIQKIDNSVIYAASPGKMNNFLKQINTGDAVGCDFDLEDRNFYDKEGDDNMGILRSTIVMKGGKSSFILNCNKYNSYKIKYALEYTGGEKPGTNEDKYCDITVMLDSDSVWWDDDLYNDQTKIGTMTIESPYRHPFLFTWTSSNSNLNLILTLESMKNDKSILEDE